MSVDRESALGFGSLHDQEHPYPHNATLQQLVEELGELEAQSQAGEDIRTAAGDVLLSAYADLAEHRISQTAYTEIETRLLALV